MYIEGTQMSKDEAFDAVREELKRANNQFPLFNSQHEGYAVIKEEVDELWDAIKDKYGKNTHRQGEAIQVAAMALKLLTSDIWGEK